VHAEAIDGRDWLVTDGLKGGEKVIVQNVAQFSDGMQVKVKADADGAATGTAAKSATPHDTKPQDNAKPVAPARADPASKAETQ
jgi:multidrug efflux system membrane fusion protein